MRRYFAKLAQVTRETAVFARQHGLRAGLGFFWRHFYRYADTVIFEKRAAKAAMAIPAGMRIVRIGAAEKETHLLEILAADAGEDVRNFDAGAICYLAWLDDRPVAIGWRFQESRFLRHLKYRGKAVYLGGFHVVEAARGQGIYPLMLHYIINDVDDAGTTVVVNADIRNEASRRALRKAGFRERGEVRIVTLAGIVLYAGFVKPTVPLPVRVAQRIGDHVRHLVLNSAAYYILEPRFRSGKWRIKPEVFPKLEPLQQRHRLACLEAEELFAGLGLCEACAQGCCYGCYSRFTVYDHISQLVAGTQDMPAWSYRLRPLWSYALNRVDEGTCIHFRPELGCALEYSRRPAICVWWLCKRMQKVLGRDQKTPFLRVRRKIDRILLGYVRILLGGGMERTS